MAVAAPPRAVEAGLMHGVWAVWGRNTTTDGAETDKHRSKLKVMTLEVGCPYRNISLLRRHYAKNSCYSQKNVYTLEQFTLECLVHAFSVCVDAVPTRVITLNIHT